VKCRLDRLGIFGVDIACRPTSPEHALDNIPEAMSGQDPGDGSETAYSFHLVFFSIVSPHCNIFSETVHNRFPGKAPFYYR
jgi:hypothetical protein